MAQMVPSRPPSPFDNYGEKFVFKLFENSTETDDWIILHSLLLQKHINQRYGEIDFVENEILIKCITKSMLFA